MLEQFNIDKHIGEIRTSFCGEFSCADLDGYFERILDEVNDGDGYVEYVDFTNVNHFSIGYSDFRGVADRAGSMYQRGKVANTVFLVSNELQYGMARMFSTMANHENSIEYTRHDSN
jgi:hypothetical protein